VLELRTGSSWAAIRPDVGGRLAQLDLGDGPLLRGAEAGEGWAGWGCFPLLPWSNRIPGGHLVFGAIDARLPVNWPDGSAIHGLAADAVWTVADAGPATARLTVEVTGGPYRVRGEQAFRLGDGTLHLDLAAVNLGDRAVPTGIGIHPWFRAGPVQVPADEHWPGEPLPTGPPVPVEGPGDLRGGAVPPPMDRCFTTLTGQAVAVPGAQLAWDGPVTSVVVYSGAEGWVAVEPVTMANDGFGLAERGVPGHGVRVVEPGDRLAVGYRFTRMC
jgi:aldose 1-epimerase